MTAPILALYDAALLPLVDGSLPPLDAAPLVALLLRASYLPDVVAHATFGDVSGHEAAGGDYARKPVTGGRLFAASGAASFTSDAISWGNPVSLPPVRYLLLIRASLGTLAPLSPLLGFADLAPDGGVVEAVRGTFTLSPAPNGWFSLTRAQ